jgi:4-amino-4-deoxy-L-arabinose transferase-like glycosyltransferase
MTHDTETAVPPNAPAPAQAARPAAEPFAWRPVAVIAGVVTLALLVTSVRYGYYGDELYFIAAGRHLAWGYVDQPPLAPLLAHLLDTLAPGNLLVLRLPATLITGAGVVLCAQIAREMGGRRRAQVLSAGAYAVSPIIIVLGHLMITPTLDIFFWTLISWLLARWIRTRRDVLLLWIGPAAALALQNKYLVGVYLGALVVAAAAVGPRRLLGRPTLWAAAVIAVLCTVPSLVWQAHNGWPQAQMTHIIAAEDDMSYGGRAGFLPLALVYAGFPVFVLMIAGVVRLLRLPELRDFRLFGWAALITTAFMLGQDGRSYYIAGAFPVLWAAGAVSLQYRPAARAWAWGFSRRSFVICALVAVAELPLYPSSILDKAPIGLNFTTADTVGWPQLAKTVERAYDALPAATRQSTVVVADTFWAQGALELYGPRDGLPQAYSPQRGAWYLGRPPSDSGAVLYIGGDESQLRSEFTTVRQVATVNNGYDVANTEQGKPIYLCEGRHRTWAQLWPSLREFA